MKHLMTVLIFFVLFLTVFAAVFYLSRRTAFVFNLRPTWFYVGYSVLILSSLVIMAASMHWRSTGMIVHVAITTSAIIFGVLLYLLMCLLVVDFVQLFAHFSPKLFGIIVCSVTLLLSGYSFWNAATPRVKTVEVTIPKLQQPMDIVQLSDVHLGHFRGQSYLQRIVDKINSLENIRAVVITGDLFESFYNYESATVEPLRQLKVPIYFVNGNHDIYTDDAGIKEMLRTLGVHVLENQVEKCGELQIVGLNYMLPDNESQDMMNVDFGKETFASVLPKLPIDSMLPSILLHHNPVGIKYADKFGIGLYLAGHTHGGQFFPLTIINDRIFEYNKGLHKYGRTQIYVSVGLGTFGLPMRLETHSELTLLRLMPQT